MDIDPQWIAAAASIAAGFIIGAILAALARRLLGNPNRRAAFHTIAAPTSTFVFWLAAVTGIVTAIGFTSPDTLDPIPADILAWLPRALAAGLILLAGYAGGGALSAAVGATVQRATRQRSVSVERTIRYGVMTAAVVLALGNVGVETTSLQILIAAVASSVALAFALIAALGGRNVATNIAAGRALRDEIKVGDRIHLDDVSGTVTALRPAVAIIETEPGTATVVPFALMLERPFGVTRPRAE